VDSLFDSAREAAGLSEDVAPYTLRHSGLPRALAAGIPPSDVARFGGTSVTMFARMYYQLLETSATRSVIRNERAASETRG
jgi:hypothetical protein